MNVIKHLGSFIISIAALLISYYWIHIPMIAVMSVYISLMIFQTDKESFVRIVSSLVVGLAGVALYGLNTYYMIADYPHYGGWLAIAFEGLTCFMFVGACVAVWRARK